MSDKHRKHFERGARVAAYCAANPSDFPADSVAGGSVKRLNQALSDIETLNVERATSMSARQQGSEGRRELREALRKQRKLIFKTAEIIGRDHPEVKGVFQHTESDRSDQTLLAVARSYLSAAQPLKSRFAEYEVDAAFFDSFNANINAFGQHMTRQSAGAGTSIAASAGIEETLKKIDDEVGRLDVIARNKYRDDTAKLAAWLSISHLERSPRRKNAQSNGDKGNGNDNNGGITPK